MQSPIVRLTLCGLLLITTACAPQLAPTPTTVVLSPTVTAAPPTPTSSPPTSTPPPPTATPIVIPAKVISDIDTWLGQISQDGGFTGAVLIAHQGEVLLSEGYGLADRDQNIPNTPQTRFRLGSITKQFTAMAILILQTQGKLSVQDRICDYIVDCPSAWEAITIHRLLVHTSGIPDFTALPDYRSTRATPSPPEQTITRFKDLPLDFPPDLGWRYSNSGYVLLGYIIEQVSGQSYEAFLQEYIFDPLNLSNTGYDHNANGLAVGYNDKYSNLPADFIDMSIPFAAGALYSTVEDLYAWDQALYTDQLISQDELEQMFYPQAVIPNGDEVWATYGYGWFIGTEYGRTIIFHAGGIEGFSTIIARYPEDQVTFIVLSNQALQNVDFIRGILSKKVFGDD